MSTITKPKLSVEEIFRYGWRYVPVCENGTTHFENVPLTLEDTLHPQLGDHIVEGPMHDVIRRYLADVFWSRLDESRAFVLSDCGIFWNHPDYENHCPDLAIVTGLAKPKDILKENSYRLKQFGVKPCAIFEIVSRHIRKNDVETKFHDYHCLEIPLYVIVDREESDFDWKIVPYQYTPQNYELLPTDDRGRFFIELLGVWLGVENENVVCYDGKTGAKLGGYTEINRQLESASSRAEDEKQRAEDEKKRAEDEKKRADDAEAKLKELQAELARLRGQS